MSVLKRAFLLAIALSATVLAQPAVRRATNIAALLAYPGFFHTRPILIVGTVSMKGDRLRVNGEAGSVRVIFKETAPDGFDEVRGEFWDVGQMKADDPRLTAYDVRATFGFDPEGAWPQPGEVTAIIATAISAAQPPPAPTLRAIVLNPERWSGQQVTVIGQFSGRNLLGDLPESPGKSRYDFVLRSADASIWITNMRPKGKDQGKDFELGLDARIDTARWLQVSGTLQHARGQLWIDATAGVLTAAKPPSESIVDEPAIRVSAAPPPEVMFSAPTQSESDVSMGTNVRVQFSRDIDPSTIKGHVRVGYLDAQSVERGEPTTPAAEFSTDYAAANRVLEIRFAKPLERFRTVRLELLDGILGTDKQPLVPWTLTFEVGGS